MTMKSEVVDPVLMGRIRQALGKSLMAINEAYGDNPPAHVVEFRAELADILGTIGQPLPVEWAAPVIHRLKAEGAHGHRVIQAEVVEGVGVESTTT
jgi:hypothetical protein